MTNAIYMRSSLTYLGCLLALIPISPWIFFHESLAVAFLQQELALFEDEERVNREVSIPILRLLCSTTILNLETTKLFHT